MTDSENMFDAGKIGVFCDSITHSTEDRRGTETKIVVLGLRVDPFDAKLAIVLDQRLRNTLFTLGDATPHPHIRRIDAALGILRQNLHVFATPETETASRALLQVQITNVAAKVHKDRNEFALTFKASFGPADKHELEFVEAWRNNQQFLRFERSEPSLEFDGEDDADTDGLDVAPTINGRPTPMWDDGDEPALSADEPEAVREIGATPAKKRGTKKKTGRHNPDAERAAQVKDAKGKPNGAAHA